MRPHRQDLIVNFVVSVLLIPNFFLRREDFYVRRSLHHGNTRVNILFGVLEVLVAASGRARLRSLTHGARGEFR